VEGDAQPFGLRGVCSCEIQASGRWRHLEGPRDPRICSLGPVDRVHGRDLPANILTRVKLDWFLRLSKGLGKWSSNRESREVILVANFVPDRTDRLRAGGGKLGRGFPMTLFRRAGCTDRPLSAPRWFWGGAECCGGESSPSSRWVVGWQGAFRVSQNRHPRPRERARDLPRSTPVRISCSVGVSRSSRSPDTRPKALKSKYQAAGSRLCTSSGPAPSATGTNNT